MARTVPPSDAHLAVRALSLFAVVAMAAASCGGSDDEATEGTAPPPTTAAAPATTGAPTTVTTMAPVTTETPATTAVPATTTTTTTTAAPTSTTAPTTTTGPTTTTNGEQSGTLIEIGDLFFSPGSVTVSVGATVTWRNGGSLPHTTTAGTPSERSGDWHSGTLTAGESFSIVFDTAGTFQYFCSIHPSEMQATITVTDG